MAVEPKRATAAMKKPSGYNYSSDKPASETELRAPADPADPKKLSRKKAVAARPPSAKAKRRAAASKTAAARKARRAKKTSTAVVKREPKLTDSDRLTRVEEALATRLSIDLSEHDEPAVEAAKPSKPKHKLTDSARLERLERVVGGSLGVNLEAQA
jgi:hypothetical protein